MEIFLGNTLFSPSFLFLLYNKHNKTILKGVVILKKMIIYAAGLLLIGALTIYGLFILLTPSPAWGGMPEGRMEIRHFPLEGPAAWIAAAAPGNTQLFSLDVPRGNYYEISLYAEEWENGELVFTSQILHWESTKESAAETGIYFLITSDFGEDVSRFSIVESWVYEDNEGWGVVTVPYENITHTIATIGAGQGEFAIGEELILALFVTGTFDGILLSAEHYEDRAHMQNFEQAFLITASVTKTTP